jgi:hypothetical protein
MISRVKIHIASGRGVAERWRTQYQNPDKSWTLTASGGGEKTYNALCALGQNPDIGKVAEVIGNRSWSYLSCSGCGDYVERAADFGSDYSDTQILLCEACLKDGLAAINK